MLGSVVAPRQRARWSVMRGAWGTLARCLALAREEGEPAATERAAAPAADADDTSEPAPSPQLAIDALYQQHATAVLTYLYHRLPAPADAEDALADVFVAALRACAGGQMPGLPWLIVVARRRVADYYRERARTQPLPAGAAERFLADAADLPEQRALRAEERGELVALVALLPSEQREALLLRFGVGLRAPQIARILGRSDEATRALLSRAVRRLRQEWSR